MHGLDFESSGFEWIDCHTADLSVLGFLRRGRTPDEHLIACCNFTPEPRRGYRLGAPDARYYQEIFNSDSEHYGGSNLGNFPGVQAEPAPHHGRPCSMTLTLPPLGVVLLKPR